jgi:hypothetical protein
MPLTDDAREPVRQLTTIGRDRYFSSSLMRSASCASGMCLALAICPAAKSPVSRTSSTSASRRLMSCTASMALTSCDIRNGRDSRGHSNIAPDDTASPSSSMLNGLF